MLKGFIIKYQYIIFALLGTVVVLWRLLLPGYVLLLDWVPGPHNIFSYEALSNIVSAPSTLFLYFLQMFLPGWVVQKFVLIGMFFILFYFPLRFYPTQFVKKVLTGFKPVSTNQFQVAKYFASLLFVFNPFVYERVLAGQWRVVVGYAFMFPLIYYILRFTREKSWHAIIGIFTTLLITGMWSVHFLAVGAVIICLYVFVLTVVYLWQRQFGLLWDVGKKFLVGAIVFGILSCYWIVPYKLQGSATLEQFGADHWQAFTTASDEHVGVVGNVVTLRGFWGESHAWIGQFSMPWENSPILFYGVFVIIFLLSIVGVRALWRDNLGNYCGSDSVDPSTSLRFAQDDRNGEFGQSDKNGERQFNRLNVIFLVVLFVLSVAFATGMSAYGFWIINGWLAENISFWSGFRDAQKWSGVTALVFVLLASAGVRKVDKVKSQKSSDRFETCHYSKIKWIVLFVPILFVPQMLFGFSGQLHTVWHPQEWNEVNTILQNDEQCKALFLPWHQYYPVKFNDGMLIANPSHRFFDCDVVAGHNTELGGIASIAGDVENYHMIEKFVMSNNPQEKFVNEGLEMLQQNNIKYIIWTNDLEDSDLYKYPFLHSASLERVFSADEIILYEIE